MADRKRYKSFKDAPDFDTDSSLGLFARNRNTKEQEENKTGLDKIFNIGREYLDAVVGGWKTGRVTEEYLEVFKGDFSDETIGAMIKAGDELNALPQNERMMDFLERAKDKSFFGALIELAKKDGALIASQVALQSMSMMAGAVYDSGVDLSQGKTPDIFGYMAAGAGIGAGTGAGVGTFVLPGIGTAFGAVTGGAGGALGGISTGLENGLTFVELLKEELAAIDQDMTEENAKNWLQDKENYKKIKNKALKRGLTIGAVDMFTGIASGGAAKAITGTGTQIGKKLTDLPIKTQRLAQLGTGAVVEGAGGGVGEFLGQKAAGQEINTADIILEAFAETPGAAITTLPAMFSKTPEYFITENGKKIKYTKKQFLNAIDGLDDSALATLGIDIKNDDNFKAQLYDRMNSSFLRTQIDPRVKDEKTINKIIELEKEAQRLYGNKTVSGKERLKEVKAEIKELTQTDAKMTAADRAKVKEAEEIKRTREQLNISESIEFAETQGERIGKSVLVVEDNESAQDVYNQLIQAAPDQFKAKDITGQDGFIVGDVIVINKDIAGKSGAISVGSHELLHGVLAKHLKQIGEEGARALIKDFRKVLSKKQEQAVLQRLEDNYVFLRDKKGEFILDEKGNKIKDADFDIETTDEWFTAFSDAIEKGEITFDEGIFDKFKNILHEILRKFNIIKDFSDGRQAYNFLKEYSKNIEAGKLGKRAMALAGEGAAVEGIKASKSSADRVNKLYDDRGVEAAGDISVEYRGMAENIFNRAVDMAEGDIKQNLKDNKEDIIAGILYDPGTETRKGRTVLGLVKDYPAYVKKQQEAGKPVAPLAGFINNMLPDRAKEIFKPYGVDMAVTKSITDEKVAREVAKKEAKEDIETKIDTKEKGPRELKSLDDVNLNDEGVIAEEILNKVNELVQTNPKNLKQQLLALVEKEFTNAIKTQMGGISKVKGEVIVSEEYKAFHALEFDNIVKALPISVIKKNYNNLFEIKKLAREKDKRVDPVTGKVTYPGKGIYQVDPVKKSVFGKHFLIGGYTTLLARQKKLAEHMATAKAKAAVDNYIEENSNDINAVVRSQLEQALEILDKQKGENRSFDNIKFHKSIMKETISLFNTGKYGTMGNALEQALMNHIKRYNIPGLRFTVEETGEKGGMADLVFDFGNVRYNVEVKMTDKVPMGSTSVNQLSEDFEFDLSKSDNELLNVVAEKLMKKAKKQIKAYVERANELIEEYNQEYNDNYKPIGEIGPDMVKKKAVMPEPVYDQLKNEGYGAAINRVFETGDEKIVVRHYELKQAIIKGIKQLAPVRQIEILGQFFRLSDKSPFDSIVPLLKGKTKSRLRVDKLSRQIKKDGKKLKFKNKNGHGEVPFKLRITHTFTEVTNSSPYSLSRKEDLLAILPKYSRTTPGYSKGLSLLSKAAVNSRNTVKYSKSRGMSTFDFDETLIIKGKNFVTATDPVSGNTIRVSSEQWPTKGTELAQQGYEFDFTDFVNVRGGIDGPLLQKMKNQIKKFGPKDVFVLTARPAKSDTAIHGWLKTKGINIPIENIVGLGNSTGEAKATWMLQKFTEGYNDMYFVDDALSNVKAVKNVLDQLDIKSDVQQAKIKFSKTINSDFNSILEEVKGVPKDEIIDRVTAKKMGAKKGRFNIFVPPSNEDLNGILYMFMGKGKRGEQHKQFFKKALGDPLNKAYREFYNARQAIANDFKALKKKIPNVRKQLAAKVPNTSFDVSDAIRVYLWDKFGFDIPGISEANQKKLVNFVNDNSDVKDFAETLSVISKVEEGYVTPSEHWITESIQEDLIKATDKVRRLDFFEEFLTNADIIFSEENLNKIEAIYGTTTRDAISDMMYRIKNGTNRSFGSNKFVNEFMNWINGSIGATMFVNVRSSVLQTLSTYNFINWTDNNPFKAAKAFADQPQFWKDFAMLFNSNMLKQRRKGLKSDINASEIASFVRKSDRPVRAAINWLLSKGFLPTQIADSFAIAAGGATMFRNRVNTYVKQGFSVKEAENKAFLDFAEIAEETQQSARPDKISQQQASVLGRLILAFQNTPIQYMRLTKKAMLDLVNRRGDARTNISKIIYYTFVQNAIFYSMQSALFALAFGDDDDEKDEFFKKKKQRVANGMMDTILRGMGIGGAVVSTIKNMAIEFAEQRGKKYNRDEGALIIEALNLSPPIGIKARKIDDFQKGFFWNEDVMKEMELFNLENPIWDATSSLVQATTNVPLNRLYKKASNISEALNAENETWQRVALALGWSKWNLGIKSDEVDKVKEQIKKERQSGTTNARETFKRTRKKGF